MHICAKFSLDTPNSFHAGYEQIMNLGLGELITRLVTNQFVDHRIIIEIQSNLQTLR